MHSPTPRSTTPGRATRAGTGRYRDRFGSLAADHFRDALDLWLSSIGLGTYLGDPDEATDRAYAEAIARAVPAGCNVIDSAINYRFQRSERTIGGALAELFARGLVARDEIVVCTKGGYLSFDGGPPRDARTWVSRNFIEPGIISWGDIVSSNVMQPAYIRHQLETSLGNLRLDTIDVYYVHNPESQLDGVDRREFERHVSACFEELERAGDEGKIGVYGTATWNGYRTSPDATGYLSLDALVKLARSVAGESHRFKAIQLPLNLAMPEAFTFENQIVGQDRVTALAAADRLGLTVFASASLLQAQLTHLPPALRARLPGLETDAQRALQFVRSTPGVTTALVGMKDVRHVDENLRVAREPALDASAYARLYG